MGSHGEDGGRQRAAVESALAAPGQAQAARPAQARRCVAQAPLCGSQPRALLRVQAEARLGGHSTAELPRVRASLPRLASAPACRGPHAPPTVSERHSAAERLAGGCLAHRRPLGSTSWSAARSAARPRGFAPLRFRAGCPCLPSAPGSVVPSSQGLTPSLPQPPTPVLSGLETTRQNYSVFATEVLRGTC